MKLRILDHYLKRRAQFRRAWGPWPGALLAGLSWLIFRLLALMDMGSPRIFFGLACCSIIGAMVAFFGYRTSDRFRLFSFLCLLRVCTIGAPPFLSDDWYRYIHEGRAMRLAFSTPYAIAPKDITPPPDDGLSRHVNHPEIPAAYPPFTQLVNWVSVGFGDRVQTPRLLLTILIVLADLLILFLLFRRGGSPFFLYGIHPLPLLEFSGELHIDGIGVALLLLAFINASHRAAFKGLCIGLSAGIKPIAFFAFFALPSQRINRHRVAMVAVLFFCLPSLPFLLDGAPLFQGLTEYATRWESHPMGFLALKYALSLGTDSALGTPAFTHLHLTQNPLGLLLENGGHPIITMGNAAFSSRPFLLDITLLARVCSMVCIFIIALRVRTACLPPHFKLMVVLSLFFFFSPTIHPWYLTWVLPFVALSTHMPLWMSSLFILFFHQSAIHQRFHGEWIVAEWPRIVVCCVFLVTSLLVHLFKHKGKHR